EMQDAGRALQLLGVHRSIGRAEVDRALRDLANPAAGTDRLIVDLNVRVDLVVFGEPLGINRGRESRSRAVQLDRLGRGGNGRQSHARGARDQVEDVSFHFITFVSTLPQ